jgi:hypothetical protein
METRGIFTRVTWIAREFKRQNTNNIWYWNIENENAEEPLQKRQHFTNLESEDL